MRMKVNLSKEGTSVKWAVWDRPISAHLREVLLYVFNVVKMIELMKLHLKQEWNVWNMSLDESSVKLLESDVNFI